MIRVLVGLLAALVATLTPNTAHGHEPLHRMAATEICVQPVDRLEGWRLARAVEIWNSTGVVSLSVSKCDTSRPHIYVHQIDSTASPFAGWAEWPYYEQGHAAGPLWLYLRSDITLNRARSERGCDSLAVTVHELGHALGLPHNNNWNSVLGPTERFDCEALPSVDARNLRNLYESAASQG